MVNLNAYLNSTVKIKFHSITNSSFNSYGWYLDDVTVSGYQLDAEAPNAPTNLESSNIKGSGFTLSWTAATDNIAVTSYDISLMVLKIKYRSLKFFIHRVCSVF